MYGRKTPTTYRSTPSVYSHYTGKWVQTKNYLKLLVSFKSSKFRIPLVWPIFCQYYSLSDITVKLVGDVEILYFKQHLWQFLV